MAIFLPIDVVHYECADVWIHQFKLVGTSPVDAVHCECADVWIHQFKLGEI